MISMENRQNDQSAKFSMAPIGGSATIDQLPPDQLPLRFNISQYLLDSNIGRGLGNKIAIYFEDRTLTYSELSLAVNKLGNLLKSELGVDAEARVALLLFDCPKFVISFLAIIKIGAVAVPVSTMLDPEDYLYVLNDTQARVLIVDEAFLDVILSMRPSLEYLKCIVVTRDRESAGQPQISRDDCKIIGYREAIEAQPNVLETAKTHKNDAAFWVYTSGSTGKPKAAIHLQHDIYYAAFYLNQYFYNICAGDLLYSASKLFFSYGLGNSLWIPFFSGASAVLEKRRSTGEIFVSNIRKYRPTKVYAVPTIYKAAYDYLTASGADAGACRSVERYYSAGEPLSQSLYDKWLKLSSREILTVLGSTEALQGYVGATPGMGNAGCLGRVIPGYKAKIVDDTGQEVKPHGKGVLMIRGDSIASGYWNRPIESKKAFRGDWFYTGDMVYATEDGILWYAGRNDEMFKIAGLWVSPVEIEEVLSAHPSVQESAVVSYGGAEGLVSMVAYIVSKQGAAAESEVEQSLREFLQRRLPSYKCPRTMRFIRELPRSSTGKLQRFKLKELHQAT